jgi:hypothetical protein
MEIIGIHVLLYSKSANAVREFLGDTLGLRSVEAGPGWPIFAAPPAEIAAHPADGEEKHEMYLMCDDIESAIRELEAKGCQTTPIHEERWGRVSQITIPGGTQLGIYEPRHILAFKTR